MTRARLYTLFALALLALPAAARAQDLGSIGSSGASTRAPLEPMTPADKEKEVKVLPDKTKPMKDYLIPCGQGCAFEAAQESMAVLGFYFQNKKISSQIVQSKEYIENVKKCTRNAAECATGSKEQERFLDSALHYQFGKDIRAAYLENSTNRENIRSLGYSKDDEAKEPMESLDYKWYRGEGTWKSLEGKVGGKNEEHRERDNYQFDLNQLGDRETEIEKLKNLDPEFVNQYQAFFNKFTPYNDRAFVKARQLDRKGRALASNDGKDSATEGDPVYVLSPKKDATDPKNSLELHEGIKRDVNNGTPFEILRDASKQSTKGIDANKTLKEAKIPQIFKSDDAYFDFRRQNIKELVDQLDDVEDNLKKDPTYEGKLKSALAQVGVPNPNAVNLKKDDLRKALQDADKANTEAEKKNKSSLQIATDLNRLVEQVAESKKSASDADRKSISVTLNLEAFDNFLERIWPTEEGEKYRAQIHDQVAARKTPRIAIEELGPRPDVPTTRRPSGGPPP